MSGTKGGAAGRHGTVAGERAARSARGRPERRKPMLRESGLGKPSRCKIRPLRGRRLPRNEFVPCKWGICKPECRKP